MEGEMQEVDAWQGRAGAAGLQELAELECLCAQGMRKRLGFPSYARHRGHMDAIPLCCSASASKFPGAKAGKQPETHQGKGNSYIAK